jgi:hypothetical protein
MQPKVKFVTVVWGESYITRFATLALPSFIAPGNLAALAAGSDLEVVILTQRSDFGKFDEYAAFRKLRTICPTRFVAIDDLITASAYGFTLTLAYARAVIACGEEMLSTHFVFMNADFVLADGSLRSLLNHIHAGRSIVLAPSFRATAETVEPALRAAVDAGSHTLAIAPRRLVSLALPHPHPTTVAKIVNQGLCHSVQPNQFFWRVDHQTMLGRYFLIFMLCLRPERIVTTINSYCDYSFVPEMCPSGDEVVMGDSDEFFMLELQLRRQETMLLRPGPQSPREIARSLSGWTTPEHRRAARHDIVFHAGELPPALGEVKAQARAFIQSIDSMLEPAMSHVAHPHWIGGVDAFRALRMAQGFTPVPPELDVSTGALQGRSVSQHIRHRLSALFKWLMATVQRHTLGRVPLVTPLHPRWLDYLHLRRTIEALLGVPGARILVVREHPRLLDSLIAQYEHARLATPREVLDGSEGEFARHNRILIYLPRGSGDDPMHRDLRAARRLVARCRELMVGPHGSCHIFVHQLQAPVGDDTFAVELVRYLDGIVEWPLRACVRSFVGGRGQHFNARLFNRIGRSYLRFGPVALLWVLPLLAIAAPLILLTNLWSARKLTNPYYVAHWSSALISVDVASEDRASEEAVLRSSARDSSSLRSPARVAITEGAGGQRAER